MKRSVRLGIVGLLVATSLAAAPYVGLFSQPALAPHAPLALNKSHQHTDELRATFLGVSTILLTDGKTAIMTDGFFSRPGRVRKIFGKISPDPARIDFALHSVGDPKLAAVLVAHSHHDHAMDSAVVALRSKAVLIGSESTANIARGAGFPEAAICVIGVCRIEEFGRFKVTPYRSEHSDPVLYPGKITARLRPPLRASDYREGGSYSFLIDHGEQALLIHPSANFLPGMYKGVHADVVFLGIARLGKQSSRFADDYWREVVQATWAKLVIPVHWDDFTLPLDRPLQPMPALVDDFDQAMDMLNRRAKADGVTVRLLPAFESVDVMAAARDKALTAGD